MMNKIVLEGLTFRIDKHCQTTVGNLQKLLRQRQRQAFYAFRKMFSQNTLEGNICGSEMCREEKEIEVYVK
jgi:hypothetical protein